MTSMLRNPGVLTASLGHMAIDMVSSALPVLLPLIALRFGLSNAGIGVIVTLYGLASALTQPLFGLLVDRWDTRWIGIGGILWQVGCFAAAAFLPGYGGLGMLVLSGLGSGAFHPQGSLFARRAAGRAAAGGTSVFFFFGMVGHAVGPILAGLFLSRGSLASTILGLATIGGVVALLLMRWAPHTSRGMRVAGEADGEEGQRMRWTALSVGAFLLFVFLLAWPAAAAPAFLPKWLADAGIEPGAYGSMLGLFMLGTGIGNLCAGWLGDRWSRKGVIILAMTLAPLPFYVLFSTPSTGAVAIGATALAGMATGMPNSIVILIGQNLFPSRMGLGSGLILGYMFCMNALAAWFAGILGDWIGLQETLQMVALICAAAAGVGLFLPRTRAHLLPVQAQAAAD